MGARGDDSAAESRTCHPRCGVTSNAGLVLHPVAEGRFVGDQVRIHGMVRYGRGVAGVAEEEHLAARDDAFVFLSSSGSTEDENTHTHTHTRTHAHTHTHTHTVTYTREWISHRGVPNDLVLSENLRVHRDRGPGFLHTGFKIQ